MNLESRVPWGGRSMIEIQKVSKSFGAVKAVDGVSAVIEEGGPR